jgi:hypothetical protein
MAPMVRPAVPGPLGAPTELYGGARGSRSAVPSHLGGSVGVYQRLVYASPILSGRRRMAETLAELRGLPDEELIQRHDKQAGTAEPNVNYYLTELARRDLDRQTSTMGGTRGGSRS